MLKSNGFKENVITLLVTIVYLDSLLKHAKLRWKESNEK